MCEKVNIIKIINVGGKAFEHTAIKTAVIIFQKNGLTKNIEFMDIPDDCNSVKRLMIVPFNNIKNNNYNLTYNAYITKKDAEYSEGVVVKTLGEVCEFQNGSQLDKKNIIKGNIPIFGGGVKIVGYHNIHNRIGNETIVCGTGLPGYVNYNYGNPFWASQCFTMKSKNINIMIDKYLYYYSKIILEMEFMSKKKGVAQKFIRYTQVTESKIPIPSLEIQQEIVEECEQITKSIDTIKLRKEQLKCDGILFKKYYKHNELNEIYKNSEVKTLGEVCNFIKTGKNKPNDNKKGTLYPYYGTGSITGYTDEYLFDGQYILTARNGTIGNCFLTEGKIFPSDHMFVLDIKNVCLIKYIYYILSNNKKLNKLKTGIGIPNITKEILETFKIPIPSLENQEKVVAYYEQMTDEYKKHILDKIDEHNRELEMYKELCVNMFSL